MPLSSNQLAALVERARHKAVTSPPPPPSPAPQRPVRSRQAAPVSQAPSTARIEPRTGALTPQPNDAVAPPALSPPPSPAPSPQSEHAADGLPDRLGAREELLALPSQVLCHLQAARCSAANTPTCSSRSGPATPSISARTAGASCWPDSSSTLPVRAAQVAVASPSCRRAGSRRHRPNRRMPKAWQKVRPNEAIARAINATDWQPLSGMMKKRAASAATGSPCRSPRPRRPRAARTVLALRGLPRRAVREPLHRPVRSARSSLWNFNWPNLYASRRRFMPVVCAILGSPSAASLP